MTWTLILASARHIVRESNSIRDGSWQTSIGRELDGKVLGVLGLGNIGREVARVGIAFGMKIIAWSQNMTPEIAEAAGATLVTKEELFRQADVATVQKTNIIRATASVISRPRSSSTKAMRDRSPQ
ncbi:MAG: NAD(P)-dependent oxidoreductase [Methylocella sp.]